jgi:phage terminase Nu1 subunit (DNA packaging protein)
MKSTEIPSVRKAQGAPVHADPLTLAIHSAVADALKNIKDELLEVVGARPVRNVVDRQELCNILHVSAPSIRQLEDEGMPKIKLGAVYRYDLDRVMTWLESREGGDR